jgi:hypothetical protein
MQSVSHTPAGRPIANGQGALTVVWPDKLQTFLLRSCLGKGPEAEQAWHQLVSLTGDPKPYFERDLTGLKGLLPLMHSAARRNGFTLDRKMWTYLRSAALREELRNGVYRELCGDVLGALADAGLPVIALKACALAEILYDAPAERHCHAIDLMAPGDALPRVTEIIRRFGFRPARIPEAPCGARQGFRHESGLPLVVHTALFDPPIYPGDVNVLWDKSAPAMVANVSVRVLAPAHNLLHVLTAAFHDRARGNLRWACDAWLLIQEMSEADWREVIRYTQESRLELPVLTMLGFLAESLDAPVPGDLFAELTASAQRTHRPGREAALSGAIIGISALREAWFRKIKDPEARRELLRFLLLPSSIYLRWRYGTTARAGLPLFYAYRPLSYVAERLWWRAIQLPGLNRFTRYRRIAAEMDKLRA